jgi:excinuclease ABC subunit B
MRRAVREEEMDHFRLVSPYSPTGDQPEAIRRLVDGFREGNQFETLLGVTGSGKTFTMANVIAAMNKPTLVISHNKTLAGQLYGEFKEFFPDNAVEYFVSYYDYYQPEAYVPSSDTYIAKDSAVNDEIDRLRLSATAALTERRDVIVVASVSCIYGLGSPDDYEKMSISLRPGMEKKPEEVADRLIAIHYTRNDADLQRGCFRMRGDVMEINPAEGSDYIIRVEYFGDTIDRITEADPVTGRAHAELTHVDVFPASHYVVPKEKIDRACDEIQKELDERVQWFRSRDKLLEAQRIAERTNFDIEMLRETGFCSGIENYSRPLSGRAPGSAPMCLMDFFRGDFMIMIDESHISPIPQIGAMYHGDQSRKKHAGRLRIPAAVGAGQPVRSASRSSSSASTRCSLFPPRPAPYEAEHELLRAEQIIRPTGLLDPEISVRPGQRARLMT